MSCLVNCKQLTGEHCLSMEDFESQFAELSFKVAKLKVSLRIKRYRSASEDDENISGEHHEEVNPAFCETSPEIVSRRSSISSADSGFSSSLVRSRVNSVSSMEMRMPNGISRRASDCFVSADEEFDTYLQPTKQLPSVKPPTQISCPMPQFRISPFDSA